MWLLPILWLFIYGMPILVLGAVNLACVPKWRVTVANLFIFLIGGLCGVFLLLNLVAWVLQVVAGRWNIGFHEPQMGAIVGYIVMGIGAELGGVVLISVRYRMRRHSRNA